MEIFEVLVIDQIQLLDQIFIVFLKIHFMFTINF